MNLDLTVAREAAEAAATAAQELIGDYLASGQWGVTHKGDNSPVTEVDVASEHAIKAVLLHACPEAAFYGEETGHSSGDAQTAPDEPASQAGRPYRWLVDPIDGTKSFIRGMPFYSTQIALEVGGELKLGVSNAPAYGERLVAVQGEGVWLNGRAVQCSDVTRLEEAYFSAGNLTSLASDPAQWGRYASIVASARRVRGYGDFCHYHQLCCGQTDLIIESDVNILDIAALSVAVACAGGVMTDLTGAAINENTTSVLAASTAALHAQALAVLTDPSSSGSV